MKKSYIFLLLLFTLSVNAVDIRTTREISSTLTVNTPEFMITHEKPFFGLAFIYNSVQPIYLIDNQVFFVDPDMESLIPQQATHVGWKSRYQLALIPLSDHIGATFKQNQLLLKSDRLMPLEPQIGYINSFPEFSSLKYAHLWDWLRAIALGVEWLLVVINDVLSHWGWSIIVLAVVIKLLLLPVSLMTWRFQRQVSHYQSLLAPRLEEIKKNHTGETAHNHMMQAHKALGITPFYSLKPLFSNFIQIPILIAIFNVLGEASVLEHQSFLWISDLSVPDTLFELGFTVPLFGSGLNLLPFLMTVITLLSTISYKNDLVPFKETRKQKINLYLMAFAFFVLFYPFPASMVLYWAMANVLQFIQQKVLGN